MEKKIVNIEQIRRIKEGNAKKSDLEDFTLLEIMEIEMGKEEMNKKGDDAMSFKEYMGEILECSPELVKLFIDELDE